MQSSDDKGPDERGINAFEEDEGRESETFANDNYFDNEPFGELSYIRDGDVSDECTDKAERAQNRALQDRATKRQARWIARVKRARQDARDPTGQPRAYEMAPRRLARRDSLRVICQARGFELLHIYFHTSQHILTEERLQLRQEVDWHYCFWITLLQNVSCLTRDVAIQ